MTQSTMRRAVGRVTMAVVAGILGLLLVTPVAWAGWSKQRSGCTEDLHAVTFIDKTHGWAVGESTVVLRTSDGGRTWKKAYADPFGEMLGAGSLFTVAALSKTTVLAGGDGAVLPGPEVFRSTDGGITWESVSSSIDGDFVVDICRTGRLSAVSVYSSPFDLIGDVLFGEQTTDGGLTWDGTWGTMDLAQLQSADFVDARRGWVTGRKTGTGSDDAWVARTTDGGATWVASSYFAKKKRAAFNDIDMVNRLKGWVVGGDPKDASFERGLICRTANGGRSWVRQKSGSRQALLGVSFAGTTKGWVVGARGTTLYTANGGRKWVPQKSRTTALLRAVDCVGATRAWAVGDKGTIISYRK